MAETTIAVQLRARASRDELVAVRDGVLQARVTAPPVDGRANRALCKLLARHLKVAPSRVTVVRGEKSRDKLVRVDDMERGKIDAALAGL
jgi:uncharacterized protein (TIGR00251 family)